MKRIYKIALILVLIVAVLLVGAVISPVGRFFIGAWLDVRNSNRERRELLYETDHFALLQACREVMTNRLEFARDPYWHNADDPKQRRFIDPRDPRVPAAIRSLHPRDIAATDAEVSLELHGGFDHYGVIAYSATNTPSIDHSSGPLVLLPGLFYYDEGLTYDREKWIKKLKAMKPKNAAEPSW